MSFFKSIARVVHPLSRLFLKDKKRGPGGPAPERPEDIQEQWEAELKKYGTIGEESQAGAIERAKRAGTYAPTTAFKEQAQAEGDAATRQLQYQAQARMDALKKRYEDLVSSDKKYKNMAPTLAPKAPPGTV